ncbi:hypothetical protein O3P69_014981 [Scylla paramamosain]|uniref:RING-type domain-containing protein n=1 Tax=Scylla paramamosain TaxID=85552 RepID=A0AAW0SFE5_SCYPA
MKDDNVEDCPVCLTTFDDTLRRPHNLPCGHTVCSPCIDGLKQQGAVTCPTCRASHAVPEAGQFPIAYAVEGLMVEVVPAAPPWEVFLDLAWPGSAARRVVVSLPQDTLRGPGHPQFMLLCSGQRGACYANTRLFKVVQGLDVVQEAAQHRPITEVTVVQCGMVLSR